MDDWDAPAVMTACREVGFEIPRDLVVISTGIHSEVLPLCPVPLSGGEEDHQGLMKVVVEQLEKMFEKKIRAPGLIEVPPLGVIERASTAAWPSKTGRSLRPSNSCAPTPAGASTSRK